MPHNGAVPKEHKIFCRPPSVGQVSIPADGMVSPKTRRICKRSLLAGYPPYSLAAMKRSGIAVNCSALSGFVIMFHSYDYIPLFVPFFDISVSLDNLFQRIASIYDRFYLPRLNKLFEEN